MLDDLAYRVDYLTILDTDSSGRVAAAFMPQLIFVQCMKPFDLAAVFIAAVHHPAR